MLWTLLAGISAAFSSVGSALLFYKLYRDKNVRASSVRWLLSVFFAYQWLYSMARVVYFVWLAALLQGQPPGVFEALVASDFDLQGIHAVLELGETPGGWVAAVICIGDTAHFGLTLWVLALTHELSKVIAISMDRGEIRENSRARRYAHVGHGCIALFLIVEIILVIVFSGYSVYTYALLLVVYLLQMLTLVYMVVMVTTLKLQGRSFENVHGSFVASPLYQRLKRIMLVYAIFALQFQLATLIVAISPSERKSFPGYMGVSAVLYYLRGFVLAVVTGCSQPCVLRAVDCCLSEEIKEHLINLQDRSVLPTGRDLPYINPVFVFTDIESSSALWAAGDGTIMQQATQVHDDILRSLLASYRGYEITTAGDSFQLVFHTIEEATAYCLETQMQLLRAKWPEELHGLVPATQKVRVGTRLIFRGLRVRMGIHDAVGSEGCLVQHVHAVTGKMTYTGVSEVIANEIGDLGAGGQVLVTKRVADWLRENASRFATKIVVEPVCEYSIPQVNALLELSQVLPERLSMRRKVFAASGARRREHMLQIESESRMNVEYMTESQTFVEFLRASRRTSDATTDN